MLAGKRIVEAIAQHAVVELRVAHAVAPPAVGDKVWRHVHVLHPAGNGTVEHAEHDLLRGRGDPLCTGAAHAVDRHGGNIDRYPAIDGGLPRRIHLVAGLDHIAHHHRSDLFRVEFRAVQHRPDGNFAQVRRRYRFQAPVISSDRGPHGFTKDDFTGRHFLHSYSRFTIGLPHIYAKINAIHRKERMCHSGLMEFPTLIRHIDAALIGRVQWAVNAQGNDLTEAPNSFIFSVSD
jgi:hypothetical protein